jgi:hypothetical protein
MKILLIALLLLPVLGFSKVQNVDGWRFLNFGISIYRASRLLTENGFTNNPDTNYSSIVLTNTLSNGKPILVEAPILISTNFKGEELELTPTPDPSFIIISNVYNLKIFYEATNKNSAFQSVELSFYKNSLYVITVNYRAMDDKGLNSLYKNFTNDYGVFKYSNSNLPRFNRECRLKNAFVDIDFMPGGTADKPVTNARVRFTRLDTYNSYQNDFEQEMDRLRISNK